nr:hypothetical protein [Tanacetum cinerariifolium]
MLNLVLCKKEDLSRLLNNVVMLDLGTMVELLPPKLGTGYLGSGTSDSGAKFLSDKAKGYKKKSMIIGAHLIGKLELVDDRLDDSKDEAAATEARRAQEEAGGGRHHPNMSFTNRLRAMDKRMGNMDMTIFKLSNDVEELTTVVSGMSEQYDQFYEEFNTMREEQQRVYS